MKVSISNTIKANLKNFSSWKSRKSLFLMRLNGHTQNILLWWIGSWFLYLLGIERIPETVFDELHYIQEAKGLFLSSSSLLHHPPLGKFFIRLGITLFGDQPLGWRFFSTFFGAGIVAGTFAITHLLYRSTQAAQIAALLALSNGLLWAMSTVGMLDIFAAAFSWFGLWISIPLLVHSDSKSFKLRTVLTAFFFGSAIASKWNAIVPAFLIGLLILVRAVQAKNRKRFWFSVQTFIALPLALYIFAFVPIAISRTESIQGIKGLWLMIGRIMNDQWGWIASHVVYARDHEYMSHPIQWPTLIQPIWLYFKKFQDGTFQSVFGVGNPALFILALFFMAVDFAAACLRSNLRRLENTFPFVFWFWTWAAWLLIPRQVQFFYYYLIPSLILPVGLARWLEKSPRWVTALVVACGLFFYPVITGIRLPTAWVDYWVWWETWI